jgi:hypothetical protein
MHTNEPSNRIKYDSQTLRSTALGTAVEKGNGTLDKEATSMIYLSKEITSILLGGQAFPPWVIPSLRNQLG